MGIIVTKKSSATSSATGATRCDRMPGLACEGLLLRDWTAAEPGQRGRSVLEPGALILFHRFHASGHARIKPAGRVIQDRRLKRGRHRAQPLHSQISRGFPRDGRVLVEIPVGRKFSEVREGHFCDKRRLISMMVLATTIANWSVFQKNASPSRARD